MNLEDTQAMCEFHLEAIGEYFIPGCNVTLVVRNPDNDEYDFVLSNDSKEEVIKAVERRL